MNGVLGSSPSALTGRSTGMGFGGFIGFGSGSLAKGRRRIGR
ncbi:hypothetical protein Q2941_39995 [Bradyrhizobium sp. UFLA05-153]